LPSQRHLGWNPPFTETCQRRQRHRLSTSLSQWVRSIALADPALPSLRNPAKSSVRETPSRDSLFHFLPLNFPRPGRATNTPKRFLPRT
jgi:hypothetical protein